MLLLISAYLAAELPPTYNRDWLAWDKDEHVHLILSPDWKPTCTHMRFWLIDDVTGDKVLTVAEDNVYNAINRANHRRAKKRG